jgi:hypothetical protein
MATDKQIQANRRNAQLSTGPKSKEALAQLGQRARRHSLAGGHIVLPYETAEDYDALRDDLYRDYSPASTQECLLVDGIAQQQWKLQRANRLEVANLTTQYNSAMHAMKTVAAQSTERTTLDPDRALAMAISQDPAQLLVLHATSARSNALSTVSCSTSTSCRRNASAKSSSQPLQNKTQTLKLALKFKNQNRPFQRRFPSPK